MVKLCNLLVIVLDSCLRIFCSVSVTKILDPHITVPLPSYENTVVPKNCLRRLSKCLSGKGGRPAMNLHSFRKSRNISGRYETGINSDRMGTELVCRLEPFCLFNSGARKA